MLDIRNIILSSKYLKNEKYIDVYLNYIKESINKNYPEDTLFEKHHILPRSLFKKYINDKSNLVKIGAKEHLKCHWLLYQLFNHSKIIYALNMMVNRVDYNLEELTDNDLNEYEKFRREVSKIISNTNKGKIHTDEFKLDVSNRTKGTVVVKDINNNMFRVNVNDPRYLSGELVYYRVGYKHKESTKKKMHDRSIKGLKAFNNGKYVKYMLEPNDEYKYEGQTQEFKNKTKINNSKIFIYNPETLEQRRISKDSIIPEGFVRGRLKKNNFVGFENINKFICILDLDTKKRRLIGKEEYNKDKQIKNLNISLNDFYIANIDEYYFYSVVDLAYYMRIKYNVKLKYTSHRIKNLTNYEQYNIKIESFDNFIYNPQYKIFRKKEVTNNGL